MTGEAIRRCYCGRELHPDDATFETGWGGPVCPHETVWDVLIGPFVMLGCVALIACIVGAAHWLEWDIP